MTDIRQSNQTSLLGKLTLFAELGPQLNDNRIRLLEAIGAHGSLSAAARSLPLSYKAAWDTLDLMNNLSDHPLVIRTTGGKNGGGSQLTDYARQLISLYRALEQEYQQTLTQLETQLTPGQAGGDIEHFRQLLRRMSVRCSARNQFNGIVESVTVGEVSALVTLRISHNLSLVSTITRDSVDDLQIVPGKEITALIKSSNLTLHIGQGLRTSARNQISGLVTRINPGSVNSEVIVDIGDSKSLCAVITSESIALLGLEVGSAVDVCCKASSIILCSYN
jgi:molybdate transport system regulatory protein